jgi:hypothetical protein
MPFIHRIARTSLILVGCGLGAGIPRPLSADFQILVPGASRTILARSGDPLDGGGELRNGFDRIYRFPTGQNQITFFLNHELEYPEGGLCRLRYHNGTITELRDWVTGSHFNCSGTITSWGTILSCEEFPPEDADSLGFVIEVSPNQADTWVRRGLLGRYSHEMVIEDPVTGDFYLTDDSETGVFFRFVPFVPFQASLGHGTLYAFKENPPTWIHITDYQHAEQQALDRGATDYPRLEGMAYHPIDDDFYICVTGIEEDPNSTLGYIMRFDPRDLVMTRWVDGDGTQFANPDQIEVDFCGNLIVQEDMYSQHRQEYGNNRVVLIRPDRTVMPVLRGLDDDGEPSGLVLDPNQRRFWVNWLNVRNVSEFIEVNLPQGWNCSGNGVPEVLAEAMRLHVSPNPFSSHASLVGIVPPGQVRLDIFDARGAHWRTLMDGAFGGGLLQVAWDGRDERNRRAPRGIYFARLSAGEHSASTRIVLIR